MMSTSLMLAVKNRWNQLVNLGVDESLPASEKKFVRFTNVVAALTVASIVAYIPQPLMAGTYLLTAVQLVDALCVLMVFYLNYKRQYCYAKFTYMAVVNVFVVINACFIGYVSQVHEFLFITNIVPFLLYRVNDYKGILSGIVLSFTCFIVFHFSYPYFTEYNMPVAEQIKISYINVVMKFMLFSTALYILAAYTYKTEEALQASNQQLSEKSEELERSNEDLQQFAYIISHDLKAPVANIHSLLSLYMGRFTKPSDAGIDFLQHSKNSAHRLSALIEDLLSYCKVGKNLPPVQSTDLNRMIATLRMEMSERMQSTNAEVKVIGHLPVLNNVHPTMISHVFQNLISNGLKFNTNPSPCVEVSCIEEEKVFQFSVKDNGIGIPRQYFSKLFDMFKRLHTTEFEGTGMGLAICKKIVHHYHGTIWIESTEGVGTTFYFTIPKSESIPPAQGAACSDCTPQQIPAAA